MFQNVNNLVDRDVYCEQLVWADVKIAHEKGSRTDTENYRPVRILPNISKIYEGCLFKQLTSYFEDHFSKYQCGFKDSYMKANPGKYHLLLSATEETNTLNIEDVCINSSKCEKLLGVNIDSNLTFQTHVESLCKKVSQKIGHLIWIKENIS